MKTVLSIILMSLAIYASPTLVSVEPHDSYSLVDGGFPEIRWSSLERSGSIIIERELAGALQRDTVDWNTTRYIDSTILPDRNYRYSIYTLTDNVESIQSNQIEYSTGSIDVEQLLKKVKPFIKSEGEDLNLSLYLKPQFPIRVTVEYRMFGEDAYVSLEPSILEGENSSIPLPADFDLLSTYEFRVSLQCETVSFQCEPVNFFHGGDVERLVDHVDWSQYEKVTSLEKAVSLPIIKKSTVLWFDTCVLVQEFESSLTLISLANPLAPVATKIIQNEFTARDNMWQIGDLLFSSQLDSEKRLQFVTAKFENETIEIIDTVTYGEELFDTHNVNKIAMVNDSTCVLSFKTDHYKERVIILTRSGDELSMSNYCEVDPMEMLTVGYVPGIEVPYILTWVGHSDYRSSYILGRDGENLKPILVSDKSVNYTKSIAGGAVINDPLFDGYSSFRVDTSSNHIYLIGTVYNGDKSEYELQTYSYAPGEVSLTVAGVGKSQLSIVSRAGKLHVDGIQNGDYAVNIYSLNGRELVSGVVSKDVKSVDISILAKGAYFMSLRSKQGSEQFVRKFIRD